MRGNRLLLSKWLYLPNLIKYLDLQNRLLEDKPMGELKLFLLLSFFLLCHPSPAQCHYSCQDCNSPLYTICTSCYEDQPLAIVNPLTATGQCGQTTNDKPNPLGIILVSLIALSCCILACEEILYYVLMLQSLGLFSLVEIYWHPALDFVLQALSYLMVFPHLTATYTPLDDTLPLDLLYKANSFFRSAALTHSFALLAIFNGILAACMVLIPLFKALRKRFTKERVHFLPDWVLDRMLSSLGWIYLLLVQQSMATLFFCLTYGSNQLPSTVLATLYFLSLALFTFNHCCRPLPHFRHKLAQMLMIIAKAGAPIFLLSPPKAHYAIFPFLLVFYFWEMIATNKNRHPGTTNRIFFYKFGGNIVLLALLFSYIAGILSNSAKIPSVLNIITVILIGIFVYFFCMELVFSARSIYCTPADTTESLPAAVEEPDNPKKIHFEYPALELPPLQRLPRRMAEKNKVRVSNSRKLQEESSMTHTNQIERTEENLGREMVVEVPSIDFCEANLEFKLPNASDPPSHSQHQK